MQRDSQQATFSPQTRGEHDSCLSVARSCQSPG